MSSVARSGGNTHRSGLRGGASHPAVRLWLVLGLCLAPTPAHATWDQYLDTDANGPPHKEITALAQGRRGEIVVGTQSGPSVFDGERWQPLDPGFTKFIKALAQDHRGTWWLGTEQNGLWSSDSSGTRQLLDVPEVPAGQITALLTDAAGDLWVGMNDRLVHHRSAAGTWEIVPLATLGLVNPSVIVLFEDHSHRLWVGTPEGASVATPDRSAWRSYTVLNSGLAPDSVFSIGEDRDGGIWFGTYRGHLRRLDTDGTWRGYEPEDGVPPAGQLNAIARDSTGGMWIASSIKFDDGFTLGPRLARFDGRTFRPVPGPRAGTDFQDLDFLLVDDPGNLWIGSAAQGVFRSNGIENAHYMPPVSPGRACMNTVLTDPEIHTAELPSACIEAMLEDHAHNRWLATKDEGLVRLRSNGQWSLVPSAPPGQPPYSLTSLHEDRAGNLWVGTAGSGVLRYPPARDGFVTISTDSGLASPDVVSLTQDAAGAMWVGTRDGVFVRQASGWLHLLSDTTAGAFTPVYVARMVEDASGTMWILTDEFGLHQLWSVNPGRTQVRLHGTADGLSDDQFADVVRVADGSVWVVGRQGIAHRVGAAWDVVPVSTHHVGHATTMFEDRRGRLWVGGTGVARREGSQWVFQGPGLTHQADPVKFVEDRLGRIWFAATSGLAYTNGDDWKELPATRQLAPTDVRFFEEDTQGRLWAAGQGGLTIVSPDRVAPQTVFRLPPPDITTARNVSFAFGAAYLETAELEFEVTTDGVLAAPWGPLTSFTMTNLSDGEHTFSVRARDWARNVDPTPARITFTVDATPPQAVISSPTFREPVRGVVALEGLTGDPRYVSHSIEVRRVGASAWTPLVTDTLAVTEVDTLLVWDTHPVADPSRYPDGDYELRLLVQDNLGLVGTALVTVIVDNEAPFADVTSPVEIRAAEGGDVFTTNREVHLYIPPLALDNTARVSIDAADPASVPATLPDGAVRVGEGWAVAWPGATLSQPGVLEMRVPVGETRALAIYKEESAGLWARLGGAATSAGAPLSVPLASPARYALFAGGTPAGGAGLSGLALAPRAFSPQGAFGSRDVAIGFTLGRPGSVSVKVFNRAGRLQRVVADGLGMPAGSGVVRWDGRDRDGRTVPEGLYLVTVEALGDRSTQTLAVLK